MLDLKSGGYTFHELRSSGFSIREMKFNYTLGVRQEGSTEQSVVDVCFSAQELKQAGVAAAAMKAAEFTVPQLKDVGYTLQELRAGGFSAKELRTELKGDSHMFLYMGAF